ncbi:MAG: hypothetical protein MZU79_04895 [Anaerotruncus sp.]|nr:hypothetical protein [Anaerotruncus sp.]
MGEEENRRISLSQAMPLAEAFEKQAKRVVVRIFLPGLEEATIAELKTVLDGYEGRCPVQFELETPHSYRVAGPERRGPEGDALGGPRQEDRVAARRELGHGRVLIRPRN